MKVIASIFLVVFVSGCASMGGGSKSCVSGARDGNGYPCWISQRPGLGIVVSMSEHVDPNKTRDVLFKKALLELAAAQTGLEVSEDSIVKKRTTVTGNDNVSQQTKVVTLASVKTANGSVTVKAKIKDEWKHPSSRKLYLWVVPVN
ncbi:MAG: hypothetical protein OEM38_01030 [Gammaproteobacteria bacterium]|nr:hypothetical protein [Gammaproteobacteria bacterium]